MLWESDNYERVELMDGSLDFDDVGEAMKCLKELLLDKVEVPIIVQQLEGKVNIRIDEDYKECR